MECLVAEPGEAARRFLSDAVAIVDQHHPARAPRHQLADRKLDPAVRRADREQRVTGAVLAVLAQVDKGNFATVAEPAPHGRDVDRGECGLVYIRHRATSEPGTVRLSMAHGAPPSRSEIVVVVTPGGGW